MDEGIKRAMMSAAYDACRALFFVFSAVPIAFLFWKPLLVVTLIIHEAIVR